LAEADREAAGESVAVTVRTRAISEDIQSLDDRLNRLMTAYVESVLSLAEYREAKNKLMDEKRLLTENLTAVEKNRVRCVNGIFFLSRGPGMLARDEQITASWPGGVESDH
jgi:hypothetical protein